MTELAEKPAYGCGWTVYDEEGFCRQHLAEMWERTYERVATWIRRGWLEAQPAQGVRGGRLPCGVKARGDCLVPVGQMLEFEDTLRGGGRGRRR